MSVIPLMTARLPSDDNFSAIHVCVAAETAAECARHAGCMLLRPVDSWPPAKRIRSTSSARLRTADTFLIRPEHLTGSQP
jgi:hypothetical protein